MENYNITCPHCGSDNIGYIDMINNDSLSEHDIYECKDCEESFYVYNTKAITKVEVSKNKWTNYKTVYER